MNGITLKPFSILSSPFDAPFWHNRVVLTAQSARARVGLHGSSVGPKMVQNRFFPKFVPRPLGVLKQVFLGRFEPMVARYDAPQFQKALKMGFLVTKKGQKWVKTAFFRMITRPFGVLKQVK